MVKIAFDHQIFSSQRFGGISRYFFELANHLVELERGKLDLRIYSPVYINNYLKYSRGQVQVKGLCVPFVPLVSRIYPKVNRLMAPIAFGRWHPDIVHETYYSPNSVAPAGSKIVITVHDMVHELYPEYFSARDRSINYKKASVERADHIICVSENTKKDLVRLLGVPPEKIAVIYLGSTLTQSVYSVEALQRRPFILYVGSRSGYKNFDGVLAAYASYAELRNNYDLVAFGGGAFSPIEVRRIQHFQLPLARVRQIAGDDGLLASLYKQAAMFVYPSLYEGFGIPPLEAMSFDCPVACGNTGSIPEVVGDAAIQFNPLCTESIGQTLVRLSSDSTLRDRLIELGRVRVTNFSWEQCAEQTLNVYRALLK